MKTNVPGKITDSLVNAGAVPIEDKDLYEYGIRQGILLVINIATAVLIGLLLGMLWQTVIFLVAYNPVRSYAGGYHAGTPLVCYLISIPMILAVLFGIKLIPWNGYAVVIVLILTGALIWLMAPVEDANKPLDQLERKVYGRKARISMAVLSGLAVVLWLAEWKQSSLSIVMALGVASVMLILGTIKNKKLEEKA
ncbi:MAG TPA: accessory gene regulator B family protein [Bacillota bacterium]|nr:accessory gene regulator B family protein [Bacillota bacterium]